MTVKVKKKQNKFVRVISKLNPTTKRGAALLFVALFAVMGGGYMLYDSIASNTIINNYSLLSGSGNAASKCEFNKKGMKYCFWILPSIPDSVSTNFKITPDQDINLRACFTERLMAEAEIDFNQAVGQGDKVFSHYNDSQFHTFCSTKTVSVKAGTSATLNVKVINLVNSRFDVSSISLALN